MSFTEVAEVAANILAGLISFFNSNFFIASFASLVGAGFGVWGAQNLAERSLRRKELSDSLRQTNAAIILAAMIVNNAIALKRQFIEPYSSAYFKDQEIAKNYNQSLLTGVSVPNTPQFFFNLTKSPPLAISLEPLKNLTHSVPVGSGKSLAYIVMMEQALANLENTIEQKNEQIDLLKNSVLSDEDLIRNFFGLKRPDGKTDAIYADTITGLKMYTDDLIFFGYELTEELSRHGLLIREKFLKLSPNVAQVKWFDFAEAKELDLIPPRENYKDFLSIFDAPNRRSSI